MLYVITYDIPDDRRRTQLAKALKGFGTRVQYSVFEAHLNKKQFKELKQVVKDVIDSSEDSVRCYVLCNACFKHVDVFSGGNVTAEPNTIIV